MMDELREMARAPVGIFGRYIAELQRITRDKTLSASVGIERVNDLQAAMMREIEENVRRFRAKVGEVEPGLAATRRSPRPSLYEEIQLAARHLQHLMDQAARREKCLRAWEDQPAELLVEGYRAAVERNETETAQIYETEAERVLRRKGSPAALQAFLALRAQAEDTRLTPAQKKAQAEIEEIERLKSEITLATRAVASSLKVSGSIAAVGAGWRKGGRLRLDAEEQARTSVLVLGSPNPGMNAQMVDVSRAGMRLALSHELPVGATMQFIVKAINGREADIRLQGEVRWCRVDGRVPGRFLAGVGVVSRAGDEWTTVVARLAEARRDGMAVLEAREP